VRVVRGDVPRRNVRVLADVRVAEIGQVRHLRPGSDPRVFDLHEGACLGVVVQDRAGAKVTERTDRDALADPGVDDDRMRPDLGAGGNRRRTPEHGERMDHDIRAEADLGVDPGRHRVHDRHACEHVCLVDPVAQDGRGERELDAVVDPDRRDRVGAAPSGSPPAGGDDVLDGVGQVQLALRIARVQLRERVS
jgi:hypothetical protein